MTRLYFASILAVAVSLGAAPAFAQGSSQGSTQGMSQGNGAASAGSTGASSNVPPAQSAMPPTGAPSAHMSKRAAHGGSAHATRMRHGNMHTASADTGDAAVDQLNEMSLQSAQKGQAFNPPGGSQ